MGTAEVNTGEGLIIIRSHIITYGNAATAALAEQIREEIERMWNEPAARILLRAQHYRVRFSITAENRTTILPEEIFANTDPVNNYFRIEEFAMDNISFVDGLGCNTGYFKLDNLYPGSTTAAHEYGHTLGLPHPMDIDLRGQGVPGIMYPRGTLVDAPYQYNPAAKAGDNNNGGTMHPQFRKVWASEIEALKIHRLDFADGKAIVGEFTSVWHPDHATLA